MAYGRTITVTAGGVTLIDAQDITEDTQNCHFEINQRTTQAPNTATFRVNNPATATALAVPDGVNTQGTLTITAGYQDEGSVLLFTGDIKQRRIGKENAVTTYVEVIAADGDQAYNVPPVNQSLPSGKKPQDAVNLALQAMQPYGVTMGYVTPGILDSPTYARGQVFFSLARDVMRNVAKTVGATWSIQNGQMQVVGYGDSAPGSIAVNAQTGMIGMPQITPNGIVVRTLLNGNVAVNSSISLNEADIQPGTLTPGVGGDTSIQAQALNTVAASADGTYKVICVDRVGTLRGDEWYNEITCVGSSGFAQSQLNYPDFTGGNPAPTTAAGGAGSGAQSQAASGAGGSSGVAPGAVAGAPAALTGGATLGTPNFGKGN